MKYIAILFFLAVGAAAAETTYVTIPNAGWSLRFESPAMITVEAKARNGVFRYVGSNVHTGVTVSIHTETRGARDSEQCYETYWTKAQTNPVMDKSTIATFKTGEIFYATHQSRGEYKGESFHTANGHSYFVNKALCVDVHVSHWPFADTSEDVVRQILESIQVVR